MAKTKLIGKVSDAMKQVETSLKQISATMKSGKYVDPQHEEHLQGQSGAFREAKTG